MRLIEKMKEAALQKRSLEAMKTLISFTESNNKQVVSKIDGISQRQRHFPLPADNFSDKKCAMVGY